MSEIIIDDETPILIELSPSVQQSGEEEVSLKPLSFLEKSTKGINSSMLTVFGMAIKMAKTVKSIPLAEKPDEVQMQFGLKVDLEGNSYIVKGQAEASINVTLTWKDENKTKTKK